MGTRRDRSDDEVEKAEKAAQTTKGVEKPARKAKATRPVSPHAREAQAAFDRLVHTDALAWLLAHRRLDEVMASIEGPAREASLGILRYVHYRRSPQALEPAAPSAPGYRFSLSARDGALIGVALVAADHPSEGDAFPPEALTDVGEAWRARVAEVAAQLGMVRTEAPKRGAMNQRLSFRGASAGSDLVLEWTRAFRPDQGALRESHTVSLRRA